MMLIEHTNIFFKLKGLGEISNVYEIIKDNIPSLLVFFQNNKSDDEDEKELQCILLHAKQLQSFGELLK